MLKQQLNLGGSHAITHTLNVKSKEFKYRMLCSRGKAYIGETKRILEAKVKEHRDACQRGMLEKSAVAEHTWKDHHPITWEETTVVDKAKHSGELPLKEVLHIHMTC